MSGHIEKRISEGIIMRSFNPEYQDTMDKAIEEYGIFKEQLPKPPEDIIYSFAYWLFRYSGLIVPATELQRYKDEAAKIPRICSGKDLCCTECVQATECPHAGIGADDRCFTECEPGKYCPTICPLSRSLKYSTFQAYCNKCDHDTEHEQIRDDSGEMIETITSCLVCGDHDADVDSKEQMEDEERYFQMAGDYNMPDMPESEVEDGKDRTDIKA